MMLAPQGQTRLVYFRGGRLGRSHRLHIDKPNLNISGDSEIDDIPPSVNGVGGSSSMITLSAQATDNVGVVKWNFMSMTC